VERTFKGIVIDKKFPLMKLFNYVDKYNIDKWNRLNDPKKSTNSKGMPNTFR